MSICKKRASSTDNTYTISENMIARFIPVGGLARPHFSHKNHK